MQKTRVRLPVISPPPRDSAVVFVAADGFEGPFLQGDGPIDLLCGKCLHTLADGLHSGQIQNLVLRCPACESHNAIVSIPAIEALLSQIKTLPDSSERIATLRGILSEAQEANLPHAEVVAQVGKSTPEFAAAIELLIPKTAGDFYGLLSFILAFIAWIGSRSSRKNITINNYFAESDPFKNVGRNKLCPCGSQRKFKKCHGK